MSTQAAHNPYAAPVAAVGDAPEVPMRRPRVVLVAVVMLWTEVALGLLDSALDWKFLRAQYLVQLVLTTQATFLALSVLVNIKIWQGRNWARIVGLIFTLLGLLGFGPQIAAKFARVPFIAALDTLEMLLDLVAMYLVFGPGRAWFARRERRYA